MIFYYFYDLNKSFNSLLSTFKVAIAEPYIFLATAPSVADIAAVKLRGAKMFFSKK